jgi:hypothetical protein
MPTHNPKVVHPDSLKGPNPNPQWITHLGDWLGHRYFFYFCIVLDLAELPAVITAQSAIAWVTYVSQTVIQLLALPILQIYQNEQSEHNQVKADADHMAMTHIANQVDKLVKYKEKE